MKRRSNLPDDEKKRRKREYQKEYHRKNKEALKQLEDHIKSQKNEQNKNINNQQKDSHDALDLGDDICAQNVPQAVPTTYFRDENVTEVIERNNFEVEINNNELLHPRNNQINIKVWNPKNISTEKEPIQTQIDRSDFVKINSVDSTCNLSNESNIPCYENEPSNTAISEKPYSDSMIESLKKGQTIIAPDNNVKDYIFKTSLPKLLSSSALRFACSVCDCANKMSNLEKIFINRSTSKLFSKILCPTEDVPKELRDFYDISEWFPLLKGTLFSKNGIEFDNEGKITGYLYICSTCKLSVSRNYAAKKSIPPKFSIANGFDIGLLPDSLQNASDIERFLTNLTTLYVPVTKYYRGKHHTLKKHVSIITMKPDSIINSLPRMINTEDEKFLVIFASTITSLEKVKAMKRSLCRPLYLKELLSFYIKNNSIYKLKKVNINNKSIEFFKKFKYHQMFKVGTVSESSQYNNSSSNDIEASSNDDPDILDMIDNSACNTSQNATNTCNDELGFIDAGNNVLVDNNPFTSVQLLDSARKLLLVQNKGEFVSDYDQNILGYAFPDLFPYGRGHYGTMRRVIVSFEECCRHYLKIYGGRFAKHISFLLVIFDLCAKRRMTLSTTIRTRISPSSFSEIGKITPDELFSVIHEQRNRKNLMLSGKSVPSSLHSSVSRRVFNLIRNIRLSHSHMWGSSAERYIYRRKAFSMDSFMKSGALFVTLTPNDVGDLNIFILSDEASFNDHINLINNSSAESSSILSRSNRLKICSANPYCCAENFENICDTFFEDIVRFDRNSGKSKIGGGIFGVVTGYIGCVETQESGTLHLHSILYIAGIPGTIDSFRKNCDNIDSGHEFKTSVCKYIDGIVSNEVPCHINDYNHFSCPNCGVVGKIYQLPSVQEDAFKQLGSFRTEPNISNCFSCNKSFGGTQIITHQLKLLNENLNSSLYQYNRQNQVKLIPEKEKDIDMETEQNCLALDSIPKYLNLHGTIQKLQENQTFTEKHYRLILSRIILLTQKHNFRHVSSCFKKSIGIKHGQCRYNFPRKTIHATEVSNDCVVSVRRPPHNEYINSFSDLLSLLFRSNHDIRFLFGTGTTSAYYYAMKYVTKVQGIHEGMEELILNYFNKRFEKENSIPEVFDLGQKGRSRINSISISLSNKFSLPSTLCSLYLRRKSGMYCSHDFVPLLLGQIIAEVQNSSFEVTLGNEENNHITQVSQYTDFCLRPKQLYNLSIIEYVSQYQRTRIKNTVTEEISPRDVDPKYSIYNLDEEHPLFLTHMITKRKRSVIPDIIGPRIPDRKNLSTEDLKTKYALISLALCFPYHKSNPILNKNISVWEHFTFLESQNRLTSKGLEVLSNLQDYHDSQNLEKKENIEGRNNSFPTDHCADSDSIPVGEFQDVPTDSRFIEEYCSDQAESYEFVDNYFINSFNSFVSNGVNQRMKNKLLMVDNVHASIQNCAIGYVDSSNAILNKEGWEYSLSQIKNVSTGINSEISASEPQVDRNITVQSIQAELNSLKDHVISMREKTEEIEHLESNSTPSISNYNKKYFTSVDDYHSYLNRIINSEKANEIDLQICTEHSKNLEDMFPSISSVSKYFELNKLQNKCFHICALQFLKRLRLSHMKEPHNLESFSMFMTGEGGTGKTRVIDALLYFTKKWDVPGSVKTCAPTGIAASLINGQTFHSLIKLRGGANFNLNKKPTEKCKKCFENVIMIILDEVSMLSRKNLGALDCYLRSIFENNHDYGGIMVLFSGDLFQIPPIASDPVYLKPKEGGRNIFLDSRGYDLWRRINTVIILEKSMRQSEDEKFQKCLSRIRYGNYEDNDISFLNQRFLNSDNFDNIFQKQLSQVPIISNTNSSRFSINWKCVKAFSEHLKLNPYIVCADLINCSDVHFTKEQLELLCNSADTDTNNLPIILPLLPGMPVRITQNISVDIGISNGSTGVLKGFKFPESTTFKNCTVFDIDCQVASQLPICVYISIPLYKNISQQRFSLTPGIYDDSTVPVCAFSSGKFTPKIFSNNRIKSAKIQLKQIPIVPSFCVTSYKVQGMTVPGIISLPFFGNVGACPSYASLYVVLSRAKSISDVILLEKICERHVSYFKPPQSLLLEWCRLKELHSSTILNFGHE